MYIFVNAPRSIMYTFSNTSCRLAILSRGISDALDASTPDPSALSEQQLGMALLRSFEREHPGSYMEFARVLHHRTRTRKEIDFVGPGFGGIAIESKYVDDR